MSPITFFPHVCGPTSLLPRFPSFFPDAPPLSSEPRRYTPRSLLNRSLAAGLSANRRDALSRATRWACRASNPAPADSTRHAFLLYATSSECEVDKRPNSQRSMSFGEDREVNLQTGPAIPWLRRNAASDGKIGARSASRAERAFRHERHEATKCPTPHRRRPSFRSIGWMWKRRNQNARYANVA